MEDDVIKAQLSSWLNRTAPKTATRELPDRLIAIGSDVGSKRTENQDRAVVLRAQVSKNRYFYVGVLCDGMGGMSSGADCATLAVSSFLASCLLNRTLYPALRLEQAVSDANADVFEKYNGNGGATLSAFIVDSEGNFEAVNVGDSRVYLSDGYEMRQMSVDDTLAGQLNRAEKGYADNKLLQYIGIGPEIQPHILDLPDPLPMKRMMLTSDGIHYLPKEVLSGILSQPVSANELAKRYIQAARWCSGHDNASIIIINDLADIISPCDSGDEHQADMPSGTVQFWDCNGDVQFIGVKLKNDGDEANKPLNEPDEHLKVTSDYEDNELVTELDNRKDANGSCSKPKKTRKTRAKQKPEIKEGKPQLRIDFDERSK